MKLCGALIMAAINEDNVFLLDNCEWRLDTELEEFFSGHAYGGIVPRFFCSDTSFSMWRSRKELRELPEPRPRLRGLPNLTEDMMIDIILKNIHNSRLQFRKDDVYYRYLNLFMLNPKTEMNPFLESLSYLLIGAELYVS
jgi:hypothetical protein